MISISQGMTRIAGNSKSYTRQKQILPESLWRKHSRVYTLISAQGSRLQTPGLQDCERIHFCCFKPPVWGALLQQPWETSEIASKSIPESHPYLSFYRYVSFNTKEDKPLFSYAWGRINVVLHIQSDWSEGLTRPF